MRSTRASLGMVFCFVALTVTETLAPPNLVLRVKTKLGVDTEVAVGQVMVDNEAVTGELADFQSLALTASTETPDKPTLTLQAPGATPVSDAISLSAKDDKGDHAAHPGWMLALDLDEHRTIAVTLGGWKLERK